MASNQLPASIDDLFTLGEDIADGLHTHAVGIGVKQNTEAGLVSSLTSGRGNKKPGTA
jgi:hypothetical protein